MALKISRRDALALGLAVGAGALGPAEATQVVANSRDAIASLLAARIDAQHRGTGGLVSAVRPRGGWTARHGVVARDSARTVGLDTPFQIASLTKIFTALLLADAAMRGEIGLDDALEAHLRVSAPRFEGRAITLLDLATHTSGLPLRPPSRVGRSQDNPYSGYTAEDLHADIAATTLTRAPGSAFEYSNFGFGLLGAALSARFGVPYAQLLQQRILSPLGMRATTLTPSPQMLERVIQGYMPDFTPAQHWELGALDPAGGLFSTTRDLRKFLALWTGRANTSLERAARSMFAVRRPGPDPETQMALGWRAIERGGRTLGWSNGSAGGVRSYMAVAPGEEGVIAFANMQTGIGVDDIGLRVLDANAPVDVTPIPLRVPIAVPAAVLDRYVGRYAYAPDDVVVVERDGDGLALIFGPYRLQLFAETPTLFYILEENATFEFQALGDGPAASLVQTQAGQTYIYRREQ